MSSGGTLVLQPDETGKQLAGFKSGNPLELSALPGETVGSVLDKLNTYRGPDQQILHIWNDQGEKIPFSTVITGRLYGIVRST